MKNSFQFTLSAEIRIHVLKTLKCKFKFSFKLRFKFKVLISNKTTCGFEPKFKFNFNIKFTFKLGFKFKVLFSNKTNGQP